MASHHCQGWTRRRGPRTSQPKAVWIQPVAEGWAELPCREPAPHFRRLPEPWLPPQADREYGRSANPDGRLHQRLLQSRRAWESAPSYPLPLIFPAGAERRAAMRLLPVPGGE